MHLMHPKNLVFLYKLNGFSKTEMSSETTLSLLKNFQVDWRIQGISCVSMNTVKTVGKT